MYNSLNTGSVLVSLLVKYQIYIIMFVFKKRCHFLTNLCLTNLSRRSRIIPEKIHEQRKLGGPEVMNLLSLHNSPSEKYKNLDVYIRELSKSKAFLS